MIERISSFSGGSKFIFLDESPLSCALIHGSAISSIGVSALFFFEK